MLVKRLGLNGKDATRVIFSCMLAREERMTGRANFDLDVLFGRPSFDHVAARTADGRLFILGVESVFHKISNE
jgi:hypothetical protein